MSLIALCYWEDAGENGQNGRGAVQLFELPTNISLSISSKNILSSMEGQVCHHVVSAVIAKLVLCACSLKVSVCVLKWDRLGLGADLLCNLYLIGTWYAQTWMSIHKNACSKGIDSRWLMRRTQADFSNYYPVKVKALGVRGIVGAIALLPNLVNTKNVSS